MEPCALSLRDNGETRNARPAAAAHAFRHAERIANAARLAQRAYTQKQCALRPCRSEKDPLAVGSQYAIPLAAVTSRSDG